MSTPGTSQVEASPSSQMMFSAIRELDAVEILRVLRRRAAWMVLGIIVGVICAISYFVYAPRTYESVGEIYIVRKDTNLAVGSQGGNEKAEVSEDTLATHIKLIHSSRIIGEALKNSNLLELPSIVEQCSEEITPVEYVTDNLSVSRGGTGQSRTAHVVKVAFRHTSQEDSKIVVDAIIRSYQEFLEKTYKDVNSEAARLIREAESDLGKQLNEADIAYQEFRKKAPILWKGDESTNIHRDRFEQMQGELSTISIKAVESKARLRAVAKALAVFDELKVPDIQRLSVIDEASAPRIALLLQADRPGSQDSQFLKGMAGRTAAENAEAGSLTQLVARKKSLELNLGPKHPDVVRLDVEIKAVQEYLDSKKQETKYDDENNITSDPKLIVESYVSFLENDLAAIELRQRELEALAIESDKAAKELVKWELEGDTLRKDVKRRQELYDAVVDRLRDINMAGDYGGFINEVIVQPEPGEKVWPKLSICLLLGLVGGSALGALGVVTAELRDQSFRDPNDIKASFQLPILSHIPPITKQRAVHGGSTISPGIAVFHQPKSRDAEVFRGLRTHLLFTMKKSECQVIQISSPKQGDGKSTILANTAVSLARAGKRVLLIDSDLRRPSIHKLFGIKCDRGFSAVLLEEAKAQDLIIESPVVNLHILPCGALPSDPSELLERPIFKEVLDDLRPHYDIILVDSPPVLPVADPCIIAGSVDGLLLVIRVGHDSKPEGVRAVELLNDVGTNMMGLVINGVDVRRSSYEYGVYGYTYQYYGNESNEPSGRSAASSRMKDSANLEESSKPSAHSSPTMSNGKH